MIHGTNRARRPHDINRRRSAGNIMNLNKIFLSLPLSVSVCLSACLRSCVWALYRCDIEEERYLFNDIFSSFIFIWFARRPLVITLLSLLLSLYYFHFRCAVFSVDFLASPPSVFLFYRFVHIYSFHFGSCWKLSFRIRFFGDGFFCHLQCWQCSWTYTIFVRHEWRFLIERNEWTNAHGTRHDSNLTFV